MRGTVGANYERHCGVTMGARGKPATKELTTLSLLPPPLQKLPTMRATVCHTKSFMKTTVIFCSQNHQQLRKRPSNHSYGEFAKFCQTDQCDADKLKCIPFILIGLLWPSQTNPCMQMPKIAIQKLHKVVFLLHWSPQKGTDSFSILEFF